MRAGYCIAHVWLGCPEARPTLPELAGFKEFAALRPDYQSNARVANVRSKVYEETNRSVRPGRYFSCGVSSERYALGSAGKRVKAPRRDSLHRELALEWPWL